MYCYHHQAREYEWNVTKCIIPMSLQWYQSASSEIPVRMYYNEWNIRSVTRIKCLLQWVARLILAITDISISQASQLRRFIWASRRHSQPRIADSQPQLTLLPHWHTMPMADAPHAQIRCFQEPQPYLHVLLSPAISATAYFLPTATRRDWLRHWYAIDILLAGHWADYAISCIELKPTLYAVYICSYCLWLAGHDSFVLRQPIRRLFHYESFCTPLYGWDASRFTSHYQPLHLHTGHCSHWTIRDYTASFQFSFIFSTFYQPGHWNAFTATLIRHYFITLQTAIK